MTITYDVICPTHQPPITGVQPRDINNFWMASDPEDPDQGLFDRARYDGAFGSYDKMYGYYASTGGGGAKAANLTTRMRRYPREAGGKPAAHIALNDKDGKAGYLITPNKVMSVQLVAYDDVIQYIVDGKLIYQIAGGDQIQIEGPDDKGEVVRKDGTYDLTTLSGVPGRVFWLSHGGHSPHLQELQGLYVGAARRRDSERRQCVDVR